MTAPSRSPEYLAAWRAANPEKVKAYQDARYAKDGEQIRAAARSFYDANQEHVKARMRAYRVANPEKSRAAVRRWNAANPGRVRAMKAARRAMLEDQRCKCCTNTDFAAIYDKVVKGVNEVDHIVPIGLGGPHCCKNLQLLTIAEHKAKTAVDRVNIRKAKKGV